MSRLQKYFYKFITTKLNTLQNEIFGVKNKDELSPLKNIKPIYAEFTLFEAGLDNYCQAKEQKGDDLWEYL